MLQVRLFHLGPGDVLAGPGNVFHRLAHQVFVWHELEGMSFQEIAALTGENLNTLLSRKRYAVLHLRERLRDVYDEFLESTRDRR